MISGELTENGFDITIDRSYESRLCSISRNLSDNQFYIRTSHIISFLHNMHLLYYDVPGYDDIFSDTRSELYEIYGDEHIHNYTSSVSQWSIDKTNILTTTGGYKNILAEPGIIEFIQSHFPAFIAYLNFAYYVSHLDNCSNEIDAISFSNVSVITDDSVDIIDTIKTRGIYNNNISISQGNKSLQIKVIDVTNRKYLDPNIIDASINDMLKENIIATRRVRKKWINVIDHYKKESYNAKQTGISDAFNILTSILHNNDGWSIKNIHSVGWCFVYDKQIFVENIYETYIGEMFKLPNELSKVFYLTDIAIPIGYKIACAYAKGNHPHCDDSSYPPSDRWRNLCIGDLTGKPIQDIVKIVESMKIIYTASMYGGYASKIVSYLNGENIGNGYYDVLNDKNPEVIPFKGYLLKRIHEHDNDSEVFIHSSRR